MLQAGFFHFFISQTHRGRRVSPEVFFNREWYVQKAYLLPEDVSL